MKPRYYVLDGKTPKPVGECVEWARSFEKQDRRVANTKLKSGVRISTVFLGLDHNRMEGEPLLFETMIFDGPEDGYCERCSTWEQAEAQHAKAVEIAGYQQDDAT